MRARTVGLLLAVAAGVGIGAFAMSRLAANDSRAANTSLDDAERLAGRLLPESTSDHDRVAQALDALFQILDEEIHERRILAEQLHELRAEMTDLKRNLRARVQESFANEAPQAVTAGRGPSPERSLETRLADAGFTGEQVTAIRRLEAQAQMQQIELDDQARREGWVNTPRYFEEINALTNAAAAVRRDLGDDGYDRYLFASGRPNRIAVATVIETSPAAKAGLRPGDIIRAYGGERIFTNEQLVSLRSGGDRGAPVTLDIVRNGLPMQVTMPRGPMGFFAQPRLVDPGGG